MKDLLKQYQAKPLGEEKRYAVFLPLILVNDESIAKKNPLDIEKSKGR